MLETLAKYFTKDYQEVSLFYATLDLKKYKELGEEAEHKLHLHPDLSEDKFVEVQLNELVDYIRKNNSIEELTKLSKKETTEIAFFYVTFNLKKYKKFGEKGSCDLQLHPGIGLDAFVMEKLNGLVDHVRGNYNMETLSKL